METLVINTHKVGDYTTWKAGFDAGSPIREKLGIKIKGVYLAADDANTVTVISEVPNIEMARSIAASPELKASMERSGVISVPDIQILIPTV